VAGPFVYRPRFFPANVSAARRRLTLRGKPVTPLALRLPIQLLFLAVTLWVALG